MMESTLPRFIPPAHIKVIPLMEYMQSGVKCVSGERLNFVWLRLNLGFTHFRLILLVRVKLNFAWLVKVEGS